MQFLSLEFLLVFVGICLLNWIIPRKSWQNFLLLVASLALVFYINPIALLILVISTFLEWLIALKMGVTENKRDRATLLWTSVGMNLAQLAFFKYSQFFIPEMTQILFKLGFHPGVLKILMPVGLSFWTLQKMTLTLDVFYRRIQPEKNFFLCLLFTSFFPTLLSGPIERSRNFLPLLQKPRIWNSHTFSEGIWLFAIGAFLKAVIADNVAVCADVLLSRGHSGLSILLGIWAYTLQIYGDFAGYSYMACGWAKLLGLDITQNFMTPYLTRNISDFWKHWHISLSGWLNEYVFVPTSMKLRDWKTGSILFAIWLTFVASGLWHGTGMTFFVYGCIHAFGLTIFTLSKNARKRFKKKFDGPLLNFLAILITFHWVCFGFIFFRAPNLTQAWEIVCNLFHHSVIPLGPVFDWKVLCLTGFAVFWLQWQIAKDRNIFWIFERTIWYRVALYLLLGFVLLRFYETSDRFIYFQF